MGCDIHTYLEYATLESPEGEPYWQCLITNGGSRDYAMFGIMAGVRDPDLQLFAPRGVPEGKLSYEVEAANWLCVTDDPSQFEWDGYCSRESAESWAKYGSTIEDLGDGRQRVDNPDHHSHSWLTADELAQCLGKYITDVTDRCYSVEWDAVLAAMRAFEERKVRTRLVFWFDN